VSDNISYNETLKEIRAAATSSGMVFRKDEDGLYSFYAADSDKPVLSGLSFNMAYDNVCSGYIESLTIDQPKTASQRKSEERKRKREAGLVPVEVWVKKAKRDELRREVERLNGD